MTAHTNRQHFTGFAISLCAWLTLLLLAPGRWLLSANDAETRWFTHIVSQSNTHQLQQNTEQLFILLYQTSGIQQRIHHTLLPTAQEQANSQGMQTFGTLWFRWVKQRLAVLSGLLYQVCWRLNVIALLLPWYGLLILPLGFDRWQLRRLRHTQFYINSPLRVFITQKTCLIGISGLCWLLLAPFPLHPFIILVLLVVVGIAVVGWIGEIRRGV